MVTPSCGQPSQPHLYSRRSVQLPHGGASLFGYVVALCLVVEERLDLGLVRALEDHPMEGESKRQNVL